MHVRNLLKRGVVILPTLLFALVSAHEANAQLLPGGVFVCANCATEPTTLVMQAKQVLQYLREAETAATTAQHLLLFEREIQQLVTHPSTNIAQDLASFSNVLQQSQGLAMNLAQMDYMFQSNFQPYTPDAFSTYALQYGTWATTSLNAIHASANSAGYQGDMLSNEQQWMAQINMMNQGDNGMDQSIQIQNSIGLEMVAQMQKMRMLQISNMSAQGAMLTAQANHIQAQVQLQQTTFGDTPWNADQTGW
jgi:P-type conjugative transfer protein TrbJ